MGSLRTKPPFGSPEQVLKYLARYTHRVAILNSRLLSMEYGCVTFRWKDYAANNQTKVMKLDAVEFIRRFLLHILPSGFVRIRQFGLLANRARGKKLELCRALLGVAPASPQQDGNTNSEVMTNEQDRKRCPVAQWAIWFGLRSSRQLANRSSYLDKTPHDFHRDKDRFSRATFVEHNDRGVSKSLLSRCGPDLLGRRYAGQGGCAEMESTWERI